MAIRNLFKITSLRFSILISGHSVNSWQTRRLSVTKKILVFIKSENSHQVTILFKGHVAAKVFEKIKRKEIKDLE